MLHRSNSVMDLWYNITSKLCNPVLGQLKSFKNSFFLFYLVSE
jgi:hypothetical protein